MLCIVGVLGLRAQTDVTSTYITNADFSSTDGWTTYVSSQYHSEGNGLIGTYVVTNSYTSTTDATHLASEYCFGVQCRWQTNYVAFQQTKENATLPAGVYTITYDVENTNTATTAGNSDKYDNLFYVKVGDTTYSDTSTEWMGGKTDWTTHTINFTINEETTANFMISLGYGLKNGSNYGSGNTPHVYVSHLKMTFAAITRPTAISVADANLNLTEVKQLTVNYTPADANTDTDITWESSDPTVATVSATGLVTALKEGSTTITATTANSVSTTCTVTVTDVTPVAAPAYYSEVAVGDFYIVNAATGKYLGGANSWGTQASQIEHGIPFTVAVSDGKYTLDSHTYNKEAEHFFDGTFVDKPSTNLHITSLGSGKYSISTADGSAFVTANVNDNVVANTAANANSVLAQWYFVSKDNRDALFANATDAAPADATYYLTEANISRNLRKAYNTSAWTGTFSYGGANENQCAERYCANTDVYQTVTVPNGKYTVSCQGFYRRQSGEATSYLYANDKQVALNRIEFGGVNSMAGASEAFTNGEYNNSLTVYVTDGTLKVGIKCDATTNWTIWDNFTIAYHGPTVGGEATEIAMDTETSMTAGKWYYFDIPVDGLYNLTTTNLSDIVYTKDATILIENESSVTAKFTKAENEDLTTGRYFVKSASAQSLEVTTGAYAYTVGAPTTNIVDGNYVKSLTTLTLNYASAATNDGSAAFALGTGTVKLLDSSNAEIETASLSLDGKVVTATFTSELALNTAYKIAIAAGVAGYAAGDTYNDAQTINIHTPLVAEGTYYFQNTADNLFLTHGGNWGTEATTGSYGLAWDMAMLSDGSYTLKNASRTALIGEAYLGEGGYTDQGAYGWTLEAVGDNYYLKYASGNYVCPNTEPTYKYTYFGDKGEAATTNAIAWKLMTKAEYTSYIATAANAQAAAVATAAGQTAADQAALETILGASFDATDMTSSITSASLNNTLEGWSQMNFNGANGNNKSTQGACAEVFDGVGGLQQTINGLEAGLYKVTVSACWRPCGDKTICQNVTDYDVTRYLFANTASSTNKVQIKKWSDGNTNDTPWSRDAFVSAAANYVNTIYVYVSEGEELTIGVGGAGNYNNSWMPFCNFTLTRYSQTEANMTIEAGKYGTFVAPFDVAIPSGVTAKTVTGVEGTTLTMSDALDGTIPANTPVVVTSENAIDETFYGKSVDGTAVAGLLTGVLTTGTKVPAGSYVLQTQYGVQAFYKLESDATANTANRAYLTIPTSSPVKAFFFNDEDADGINAVEATAEDGRAIYNLAGQRVKKAQKGLYIIGGKTVLVK